MKYIPVRCDLHGWLLLDSEVVGGPDVSIECEGHIIGKNVDSIPLLETTEYLRKTRGLSDDEFNTLVRRIRSST